MFWKSKQAPAAEETAHEGTAEKSSMRMVPIEKESVYDEEKEGSSSRYSRRLTILKNFGTTDLDYIFKAYAPEIVQMFQGALETEKYKALYEESQRRCQELEKIIENLTKKKSYSIER